LPQAGQSISLSLARSYSLSESDLKKRGSLGLSEVSIKSGLTDAHAFANVFYRHTWILMKRFELSGTIL
jgi:hypothetical protein